MVNTRNSQCNGQHSNNNNNAHLEQLLTTQTQLMQAMLQTLNSMQPNQQHVPPPPPPHQSRLAEFLRTRPTTFSCKRGTITWNEFKARFRTHYVPRGTVKLKRMEFADLKQGGTTVNEYLNSFNQLSRYAPDDINTDEKKQDVFLNGLNDDIQFQLLNHRLRRLPALGRQGHCC
jgi:hypothetical protein